MLIIAVNAATGERLWDVTYNLGAFQICCGPVNRGVAVGYGKVYVATLDDHLLALNAADGQIVWQTQIVNSQNAIPKRSRRRSTMGWSSSVAQAANGRYAVCRRVRREDRATAVALDGDRPENLLGKLLGGRRARWFGTTPAIDPKLGLVIFSTGNPNPDLDGSVRQGDNLFSDSIVALDVHTGALKWYYQEVKHDVWDYDAVSNVVLFDVHQNGQTIPAAGEAGKVGWVFIVDRRTGQLIRKSDPYVMMSKNMFSTPTAAGVDMLPGANGGAEWSPPAYSPRTHFLYILAMNQLMHFTTKPPRIRRG